MTPHGRSPDCDEGRLDPRVARSRAVVLQATIDVLAERGWGGTTVEGIAERSGVAKTTIYRHWPCKADLVVDACDEIVAPDPDVPCTGDLRADLARGLLSGLGAVLCDERFGRVIPSLLEGAERDPDLARVHEEFARGRQIPMRRRIENAVAAGELPEQTDVDLLLDCLAGPLVYRRLLLRAPITPEYVRAVVDTVLGWKGIPADA